MKTQSSVKEQWPESYLSKFNAFTSDTQSRKHIEVHVQRCIESGVISTDTTAKVVDICSANGTAGKIVAEYLVKSGFTVEITFFDQSLKILESIDADDRYEMKIKQGSISDKTDFDSGYFDIAISRYGFNNLSKEEWQPAMNEVLRIIKPKGLFLLQDHFIPGPTFGSMVNKAEQYLAKMEGKLKTPFIYSTEEFNALLDKNTQIESRIKSGYGLIVDIWQRLKSKSEILPDFEKAKASIQEFYKKVCLEKYKLLIVNEEEYIHVYNISYAIIKK